MPWEHLIRRSRATQGFKDDIQRFASGQPARRVHVVRACPRIKVVRLVAQLLSEAPSLEIEEIAVDAWSGCSDFWGHLVVTTVQVTRVFRFRWDCSWRAEQQGWYDAFQLPDQIRASREFDWRCFESWAEVVADESVPRRPEQSMV